MKNKLPEPGYRVEIPASSIEFIEGSNTLWVHSPDGGTILRFKFTGKIKTAELCKSSPVSHADAIIPGDLNICLSKDAKY